MHGFKNIHLYKIKLRRVSKVRINLKQTFRNRSTFPGRSFRKNQHPIRLYGVMVLYHGKQIIQKCLLFLYYALIF